MLAASRFDVRAEAGRVLATVGIWGVAVAQPILQVFGKSPETFVFHRADGSDLVWFALAVALVAPLAIWGAGVLIGVLAPRWRGLVHAATIGVLSALAVAQVTNGFPAALTLIVSTGAAMAVTSLVHRKAPVRLWTQLMVVLPVMAVILFLTGSDASSVLNDGGFEPLAAPVALDEDDPPPSVVLVLLDEFAQTSMMGPDGQIDAVRFPNLARFGQDATWYRNATTTAGWTASAVPSLLTGKLPDNSPPFWTDHPDNLFRLLQPTHDLVVSESLTQLCPISVCGEEPSAPVPDDVEPPPPVRVDGDFSGLFGEALDVLGDRLTGDTAPDRFDDFAEEIVEADHAPPDTASTVFGNDGDEVRDFRTEDIDTVAEPRRWRAFLDTLVPADRPVLGFIHLELPHQPWVLLPDGSSYGGLNEVGVESTLHDDPWTAAVARQAHLLQASYADSLVGQLLDHLRAVDLYDDALVIIVADHGVSFQTNSNVRSFTDETAPDIAWVPLLVKPPGQTVAAVDDTNVVTIDLVPTIAAAVRTPLPWTVDGLPIDEIAGSDRGQAKPYRLFPNFVDGRTVDEERTLDAGTDIAVRAQRTFPAITAGDDPIAALDEVSGVGDLVGQAFSAERDVGADALRIDGISEARGQVLMVGGSIHTDLDVRAVVAVVDGVVVAASPVTVHDDTGDGFLLMLPVDTPVSADDLNLGLIDRSGAAYAAGPAA